MRDWLGKPLLILAAILLLLGGFSILRLKSNPVPGGASDMVSGVAYRRQMQQVLDELDAER